MNYFLSVDIGTGSLKAALFRADAGMLFSRSVPYGPEEGAAEGAPKSAPENVGQDEHEATPAQWLAAFERVAKKVSGQVSGQVSGRVAAHVSAENKPKEKPAQHENNALYIAVSGHGPSLVCVDARGEVVRYSSWRAVAASAHAAGRPATKSYYLPHVDFLRAQHPQEFARVASIFTPSEYLAWKLSGARAVCVPHHAYEPYMWSAEDIAAFGFDAALFPPARISGTLLEPTDNAYARALFPDFARVQCVAGGVDYASALIGSMAPQDAAAQNFGAGTGAVFQRSGTSVVLNAALRAGGGAADHGAAPEIAPEISRRFAVPHVCSEYYNIGYSVPHYNELYRAAKRKAGGSFEPMAELFADARTLAFAREQGGMLRAWLQDLPTRAGAQETRARIAEFFAAQNVGAGQARAAATLCALAGISEDVFTALCRDVSGAVAADKPHAAQAKNAIAVSGGHAADGAFMQLYANLLGKTMLVFEPVHCELRGNFALCLAAAGLHPSVSDAAAFVARALPPHEIIPS